MCTYYIDHSFIINTQNWLIYSLFLQRGAEVHLVPWDYDYNQIEYDGLFISNGPGDPALATAAIDNLKQVSNGLQVYVLVIVLIHLFKCGTYR